MCGISGFIGRGSQADLDAMTISLRHRGPDGTGFWSDPGNGVYLGHRRLAVLDPVGGVQPMWTRDQGLGIVFNGEIYNHQELRCELESLGEVFTSDHSDTETLLVGYRRWGPAVQDRLNGMWAFAIYDRDRRRLFCSRDRMGQKPFYYAARPGLFAFASELTALTAHSGIAAEVDPGAVRKYLGYGYLPSPHGYYKGTFKLPPGHCLTLDAGELTPRVARWWRFETQPEERSQDEWCDMLRETLTAAVRRRLVADVPVGVYLSGGVDSSAVTAVAAAEMQGLRSFSVGFTDPSFDESEPARRAAAHFGSQHHERLFETAGTAALAHEVLAALDEPMGDPSLLPCDLLAATAREHVVVALGGDGADELFAGYDPFHALKWARYYQALTPRVLHPAVCLAASALPVSHANMSLPFKINRALTGLAHPPSHWLPAWMGPLQPAEIAEITAEPVATEWLYEEAIRVWDEAGGSAVNRSLHYFTELYLADDILTKIDRAGMRHGLEARSPFLDLEMIDLARRIPAQLKYRGGETKYILKKALEPLVPDWILARPKKGFGIPTAALFANGELELSATPTGLDPSFVSSRLAAHCAGSADHRLFLWHALVLGAFDQD